MNVDEADRLLEQPITELSEAEQEVRAQIERRLERGRAPARPEQRWLSAEQLTPQQHLELIRRGAGADCELPTPEWQAYAQALSDAASDLRDVPGNEARRLEAMTPADHLADILGR